ncbi:sigma-70 family RNA polymerase sigma factor [Pseudogracilibacillus sp. SO30301A]|uniref:sigma-70 family RNA polymerase sigma factor n=1 Tax=Pseudogracilibacillus sp. SO30301A TaxID=3098291 RepID=UPI00300DE419
MANKDKLQRFYKENNSLLQNEVIKSFLKQAKNEQLLAQVLMDPSKENINELDKEFKAYYLKIKVIKYISSLIHFYTIDFDKKNNQRSRRFMLMLDAPKQRNDDDNTTNLIDVQPSKYTTESDYFDSMQTFQELIENAKLYNAYKELTSKQKKVLDLIYIQGYNTKEVARLYKETPQNISNIHKRALKKIKESFEKDRR